MGLIPPVRCMGGDDGTDSDRRPIGLYLDHSFADLHSRDRQAMSQQPERYEIFRITPERLKEVLDYDPATGEFRWKTRLGGKAVAGRVAGYLDRGYISIRIDRRIYMAHRLAWLWVYGVWPEGWLDHINRKKNDNRIDNLRLAEPWQNQANKT